MRKIITKAAALSMLIASASQVQASLITNGDFTNSCSLSGWQQDTLAGDGSDFYITGSSPSCSANVSVSDSSWNNTLYQNLDLNGVALDSTVLLSMDFSVASDDIFADDELSIGLLNQDSGDFTEIFSGVAIDLASMGDFHIDLELNNSFFSDSWSLDFNLVDWVDDSFFGDDVFVSTLSINSVSLSEVSAPSTDIPEPASMALFALGAAGLFSRRKLLMGKNQNVSHK